MSTNFYYKGAASEDRHIDRRTYSDENLRCPRVIIAPYALLRPPVDGVRIIRHRAGAWDCVVGRFS